MKNTLIAFGIVFVFTGFANASQPSESWFCNPEAGIIGTFTIEIESDGLAGKFSSSQNVSPGADLSVTPLTHLKVDRSHPPKVTLESDEITIVIDHSAEQPYVGFEATLMQFNIPGIGPKTTQELKDTTWGCKLFPSK